MRTLFERKISIALPTMLAIQSFGTMCCFAGAVVAVEAAVDLGVKSTSIGIYTAVIYVTGMFSGLIAGSFLGRYGVIRTCQVALLVGVGVIGAYLTVAPEDLSDPSKPQSLNLPTTCSANPSRSSPN